MTGWRRVWWWGLGAVGAGAAVGLVVWVTAVHPDGSGQAWGAVGAVAGVAAVVVALWQLRTSAAAPPTGPVGHSGAIVSDGSVSDSSTRVVGSAPASGAGGGATGSTGSTGSTGAIVARGDVKNSRTEYRP
ncbi:hypothetical protein [Kitasatospora griseola]|uniref:hypothetical protein n=1 Tax=Kitasatospora griseola TaxID=2064 RepID=UPI003811CD83